MSSDARLAAVFRDIHQGLPRQGPGTDAATLAALESCAGLPEQARVLDIGCGPGMQTLAIARSRNAQVVAVDVDETFLAQLNQSARAAALADRITTRAFDMNELPFNDGEFDLVWSEGAAYIMGFAAALRQWRPLLRPGGYLMVSELCWTTHPRPQPVAEFFAEAYPPMTDVESRLADIAAHGYEVVGHLTLPDEGWWTHYYTPLEKKLPSLRARYANDQAAGELIDATQREIDMRRQYRDTYCYEYFVAVTD
ncbi:MAG: methyltransferase domain-containing protein [Acidimicrobiaceae bacterium]|nr:methyltransferase domain-containing protein [Acidimicrobiaceae bacterium]MDE0515120.1 methyltransferase domain-containing protein [Acidimicrobiaceae bacterium]